MILIIQLKFYLNLVNPKNKQAKKENLYSKSEVEKNLNANIFTVQDSAKGTADYWRSYQQVVDMKGGLTGYVRCRFCNRIDVYDTYKGTKQLKAHAKECNALSKSASIRSYIQKDISITKEEKTALSLSVLQFCYMDIRPFFSIEGEGLKSLLLSISKLSSKYGTFSEEQMKKILPCANTVSELILTF